MWPTHTKTHIHRLPVSSSPVVDVRTRNQYRHKSSSEYQLPVDHRSKQKWGRRRADFKNLIFKWNHFTLVPLETTEAKRPTSKRGSAPLWTSLMIQCFGNSPQIQKGFAMWQRAAVQENISSDSFWVRRTSWQAIQTLGVAFYSILQTLALLNFSTVKNKINQLGKTPK